MNPLAAMRLSNFSTVLEAVEQPKFDLVLFKLAFAHDPDSGKSGLDTVDQASHFRLASASCVRPPTGKRFKRFFVLASKFGS